jgi:hypothetical protein
MIYPNPALNTITIESNAKGILSFLNLQNQEVLQLEITEPISIIDVSGMKSGVYIFRLTNDRTVQMGKFIKQ